MPEHYELPFENEFFDIANEKACHQLCYENKTCVQAVYFSGNTSDGETPSVNARTCFLQSSFTVANSIKKHPQSNVSSIESSSSR